MKEDANSIHVKHGADALRSRFDVEVRNGPGDPVPSAPNGKTRTALHRCPVSSHPSLWATNRRPPAHGSYLIGCHAASSRGCTVTAASASRYWRSNYKQRQRPEKHGLA